MTRKRHQSAVATLRRRYVSDDSSDEADLQQERINAEVAQLIHEARNKAGLTQEGLARLVGTTQSVISRLEQADYDGHSLTMLDRIARALDHRLAVQFVGTQCAQGGATSTVPLGDGEDFALRYGFREIARSLRRDNGFSINELAEKLEIQREEVLAMEQDPQYRARPFLIYKMSQLYGLPQTSLAMWAGAVTNCKSVGSDRISERPMKREYSRFAAKSESFARLTKEEKKTLDEFVKFLKSGISSE